MQNFIESQNIAAFTARLASEADPVTRATLIQLLAEEKTKQAHRIKTGA
jgi:hypothetical protein